MHVTTLSVFGCHVLRHCRTARDRRLNRLFAAVENSSEVRFSCSPRPVVVHCASLVCRCGAHHGCAPGAALGR